MIFPVTISGGFIFSFLARIPDGQDPLDFGLVPCESQLYLHISRSIRRPEGGKNWPQSISSPDAGRAESKGRLYEKLWETQAEMPKWSGGLGGSRVGGQGGTGARPFH
jgi:hypothetical protein